jgi:hypothetical protein
MRQGIVGWMRAGSNCCVAAPRTAGNPHATAPLVPDDFAAELVRELANMALADRKEMDA